LGAPEGLGATFSAKDVAPVRHPSRTGLHSGQPQWDDFLDGARATAARISGWPTRGDWVYIKANSGL
jgi:hypothetical protein